MHFSIFPRGHRWQGSPLNGDQIKCVVCICIALKSVLLEMLWRMASEMGCSRQSRLNAIAGFSCGLWLSGRKTLRGHWRTTECMPVTRLLSVWLWVYVNNGCLPSKNKMELVGLTCALYPVSLNHIYFFPKTLQEHSSMGHYLTLRMSCPLLSLSLDGRS